MMLSHPDHPGHVGMVVLYTNLGDANNEYPPEQQPALITRVHEDGACSLTIFYPTGCFQMQDVRWSAKFARRHWTQRGFGGDLT